MQRVILKESLLQVLKKLHLVDDCSYALTVGILLMHYLSRFCSWRYGLIATSLREYLGALNNFGKSEEQFFSMSLEKRAINRRHSVLWSVV